MTRKLHITAIALFALLAVGLSGRAALGQEAADAGPDPEPEPAFAVEPIRAPAPAAAAPDDGSDEPALEKQSKKVKIGGRVHVGYEMKRDGPPPSELRAVPPSAVEPERDTHNEFLVKRARLKLRWRPDDWFLAVIQINVAEALELGGSILRDAYIHLSPLDQLQIRIGQFKKPFSGLALQSPAKLRVIDRGPGTGYIVEDLLYGDRDLGIRLSGRLVKSVKLDYSVGVFNGSGPSFEESDNSKDVVARVQMRPIKQIEVGANLSAKLLGDPEPKQPAWALAAGGDLRVGIKGFRFYAEGLAAPDYKAYVFNSAVTAEETPIAFVVLAMVSYRHKFETRMRFAVEPVFKAELLDTNKDIVADQLWVLTPGVNVYLGEYFRVLLDGEFARSSRNSSDDYPDSEAIQVLACFDI